VIAVVSLVAMILTECISNAAVIATLMPITLSLAKTMGVDPRIMTLAVALPAGLAFCLPMGTPANAIIFSSGFLKMRDLAVPGAVIMLFAWLLFLAAAGFVWPLLGFKL
jgi:sodium-dependent dicarboxylate transporter 2/3/5